MRHDSLLRHDITYLTCDGYGFYIMTLIFDLMTFNVCSASAVTSPNHAHVANPLKLYLVFIVLFVESKRTEFGVSSFKHCKATKKNSKFKTRSRDLDYAPFNLVVLELFTVFVPCDLVLRLCMIIYVIKVHTKFKVSSCSHFGKMDEIPIFKIRSMRPGLYPPLTYFCIAYFLLLTIHLRAKLEPYSFSRSRDINRGP